MKVLIFVIAAVLALSQLLAVEAGASGQNWALLVAGSNGYYNYRHQADVCHAFQILTDPKKGNFPKENVIVMMYDDIAQSSQNPTKGTIINHPNGTDVYHGVNKDYTGNTVTAKNFLNILSGNKAAMKGIGSGKVIESTSEDNVFVYFADHGAPGLIAFPSDPPLYATDLIKTLTSMFNEHKYKRLVFYVEACESGSMFANLPKNINIFATTAATGQQSSYACYYDSKRQTYLGDEYSVRWMEDSDVHDSAHSTWTLEQQFKLVANETLQSQPQQFGDMSISSSTIQTFQGYKETARSHFLKALHTKTTPSFTPCGATADSRDVKLDVLKRRLADTTDESEKLKLIHLIKLENMERSIADHRMHALANEISGPRYVHSLMEQRKVPVDFDCLKESVAAYNEACGRFTDYSLKYVYVLVNMCESGYTAKQIATAAQSVCH